jgi:septum site-determining protein MinC
MPPSHSALSPPATPPQADTAPPTVRVQSRPALELKGLSHPALRLALHDASPAALASAFAQIAETSDAGFEWQAVVIDASRLDPDAALDCEALLAQVRGLRLHPVAIAGAPESLREAAERLQLGWLAALPEPRRRGTPADGADGTQAAPATDAGPAPAAEPAPAEPAAGATAAAPDERAPDTPRLEAMIVERPVRSGQQIYARERDLIVIGDVSPGAEVIADGNVHVYGTLGGRAIAGARGMRQAAIFTLDLQAELVAVCGIYRTFEDGPPAAQAGKPVRISLETDTDTLSLRTL